MTPPSDNDPPSVAPWHGLFAPFPQSSVPRRAPVAAPGTPGAEPGSPIAGWESLTLEFSAGGAGSRHVSVTLDETGRPISASDWVVYRTERTDVDGGESRPLVEWLHVTVGGRVEPDGSFHGTRWRTVIVEDAMEETLRSDSTPSPPTGGDARAMLAIVEDVVRRAGS